MSGLYICLLFGCLDNEVDAGKAVLAASLPGTSNFFSSPYIISFAKDFLPIGNPSFAVPTRTPPCGSLIAVTGTGSSQPPSLPDDLLPGLPVSRSAVTFNSPPRSDGRIKVTLLYYADPSQKASSTTTFYFALRDQKHFKNN
ncbi:Os10g0198366 [Oryza sativa Japonica Group]|uniref:Os10g0198366 protein n=1 Tax=Oryza sativa subsp. japonica TaxID=39947 RepID=A0A0P0XTI6_ORYSJ|nr:Os10g0198366 [Oryza sativa Japonica Group]